MRPPSFAPSAALCLLLSGLFATTAIHASEYSSFNEAYSAGVRFINSGNLAAARQPLEAALKLAPDDASRLRVNRTLMVPYRELQEIEPMQQATEYLISHSDHAATRSVTRRELLTFIHRRGKLDQALKKYEARLAKSPEDRTVLFILTEAYATLERNPARSVELAERLAAVEKKLGKAQNVGAQAQLARQYVMAGEPEKGAELYQQIAPADAALEA